MTSGALTRRCLLRAYPALSMAIAVACREPPPVAALVASDRVAPAASATVTAPTRRDPELALTETATYVRLRGGDVYEWGRDMWGDGRGHVDRDWTPALAPRPVPELHGARAIAAGMYAACVVRDDGRVACHGQQGPRLGLDPSELVTSAVVDIAHVDRLAMGSVHACVSSADGVHCWGSDDRRMSTAGRPGAPATSPLGIAFLKTPFRVLDEPVDALTLGGNFSCARRGERHICWGGTALYGQAGPGFDPVRDFPDLAPSTQVAAGSSHTCALRPDGHVACIGAFRDCELGVHPSGFDHPVLVPGIADAVAIASKSDFTCALRAGGGVACWGSNSDGQLGNGASDPQNRREMSGTDCAPTAVVDLDDAVSVAVGSAHACAVRRGGAIVCWGDNRAGQLGDATTTSSPSPRRVVGLPADVTATASP